MFTHGLIEIDLTNIAIFVAGSLVIVVLAVVIKRSIKGL